jgi:hypothetical protein
MCNVEDKNRDEKMDGNDRKKGHREIPQCDRAAAKYLRLVSRPKSPPPPSTSPLRATAIPRIQGRGRFHQHRVVQQPLESRRLFGREEPLPPQYKFFFPISTSGANWSGPSAKERIRHLLWRGIRRSPIHRVRIIGLSLLDWWRIQQRGGPEDRVCAYRRHGVI